MHWRGGYSTSACKQNNSRGGAKCAAICFFPGTSRVNGAPPAVTSGLCAAPWQACKHGEPIRVNKAKSMLHSAPGKHTNRHHSGTSGANTHAVQQTTTCSCNRQTHLQGSTKQPSNLPYFMHRHQKNKRKPHSRCARHFIIRLIVDRKRTKRRHQACCILCMPCKRLTNTHHALLK